MNEEQKRITKEAIKEAMKEWLEKEKQETFSTLGKWVTHAFVVALLTALVYFMLMLEGWKKGL